MLLEEEGTLLRGPRAQDIRCLSSLLVPFFSRIPMMFFLLGFQGIFVLENS